MPLLAEDGSRRPAADVMKEALRRWPIHSWWYSSNPRSKIIRQVRDWYLVRGKVVVFVHAKNGNGIEIGFSAWERWAAERCYDIPIGK